MQTGLYLYILLFNQVFQIQADLTCYYYNQSVLNPISCKESCCGETSMSAQTACCTSAWNSLAIPVVIVICVCLLSVCLVFFRPIMKFCLCGSRCPCLNNRSRVTSTSTMSLNGNSTHVTNNGDLPDYETVSKNSPQKDLSPPPYNFVTTHPNDFQLETRVLSAPPQYRSRANSIVTVQPLTSVQT